MAGSVLPEWMQWLQAISVIFIAGASVAIASRQATTAQQQLIIAKRKLQHDLFDRRFAIFEAARRFLANMLAQARTSEEQDRDFVLATGEARFLLDDDLHSYLDEWRRKASSIRRIELQLESLVGEEQRKPAVDAKGALLDYFENQYDELINKFRPYLTLGHG